MQHYEWESDAPAPEETVTPWRPPDWAVYAGMATIVIYLLIGLIVAIVDTSGRVQQSGLMVPLSFAFEVVVWPLRFILPTLS